MENSLWESGMLSYGDTGTWGRLWKGNIIQTGNKKKRKTFQVKEMAYSMCSVNSTL